jgi:chemotaxis protein CheD
MLTNKENEIIVGMGAYFVKKQGFRLVCLGIGSCIATVIYDPYAKVYAMGHIMLSYHFEGNKSDKLNKYADVCIPNMVKDLIAMGANERHLQAKIAGGAHMFPTIPEDKFTISKKNIEAVKKILAENKVKLIGEDLGGNLGRTIIFETDTQEFKVVIRSQNIERIV